MNRSKSIKSLIALAITAFVVTAAAPAEAGNGWGWAKPMNKRMGAFYTSNKNANFQHHSQQRTYNNYNYQHQKSYHYTKPVTKTNVAPIQVVTPTHHQFHHNGHPMTKSVLTNGGFGYHNQMGYHNQVQHHKTNQHFVPSKNIVVPNHHLSQPIANGYWQ
ncbi:hypothetical protein LOC67_09565 [Stieleria sp. JC731]|uniref:hypothetical protein n=1 Tax=Pirellulaceae TaxID=2691357 RepID=UPI001E3888D2|nr:hypothetical protein [Stieleria sp. JC731]MCC9600812.1 hypothetical protein [Stieleria sp. JC731]